jgi:aspartyl-tRNA(Asn)/glutamyl-tRNA(Gln) amidotransferase subunit C
MDRAQIRHVAELAELSLSEEEEQKLTEEVGRIVAFVKELESVDTTGVEATAHVTLRKSGGGSAAVSGVGWRPDEAKEGLSHEDALREAPRAEHGGFTVPTFVE